MTPIPLSLYVHIPWCVKKCPYCDFNSHEARSDIPEQRYINALIADLESALPSIWGRSIESVFIGGGTPSLFTAKGIDQLLRAFRERLPIRPNTEITMEANPGTFEQQRFQGFRDAGINRLSIGIQSFDQKKLESLGRIHGSKEAYIARDISKNAGFKNVNLDLMFGLPKQTLEEALADLKAAIESNPEHISWYQLTLEENTLFHHNPPKLPVDDAIWEMQEKGQQLLHKAGYQQYEVSAYAIEKQQCQHNLNYWEFGDYLGIGAGAHGKITQPDGKITRHSKYRHPQKYMEMAEQGKAQSTSKELENNDICFEFILNAARLKKGFTQELFESRTFLGFTEIEAKIDQLIQQELMIYKDNHYQSTPKGWMFLNNIVESFL